MKPQKKTINSKLQKPTFKYLIIAWSIIRTISPLILWMNAKIALIINLFLDSVDGDMFKWMKVNRSFYQSWDKIQDFILNVSILVFVLGYFSHHQLYRPFLFFFFLRLVGDILFQIIGLESILLFFPSAIIELFAVMLFLPELSSPFSYYLFFTMLTIWILYKEWWIHVAKNDLSDIIIGSRYIRK